MLSEDDVKQQQTLLTTYRKNVQILVIQAAQYNGEANAPIAVMNNLQEARDNIARIKELLRTNGVEVEDHPDDISLRRRELDQAVGKQAAKVSENDRSQVLRRAQFAASVLEGAQILWVDDYPGNNIYERRIFRSLGIFVDLARSTEEAMEMLRQVTYDVVISDMGRGNQRDAGIQLLIQMVDQNLYRWTIIYTSIRGVAHGLPQHAFAITARPDHLLHYVIDVLERERI